MNRPLSLIAVAFALALPASAQTPPKTSDNSSTTKKTDSTKASETTKAADDSKDKPASEKFPFPGDAPTAQPSDVKDKPAAEKFPFPEAESPNSPPRSDAPVKETKPNSAAEQFPFPEPESPDSPPHSAEPRGPNDSSSRDNRTDISPPPGDAKEHEGGVIAPEPAPGVVEMVPWDPHQADKDVEVGMYYFRQKNYFAAESRFREALHWQDNHAEAMYRLATVLEKEGKNAQAEQFYLGYLRILPNGEYAKDIRKALDRMGEGSNKAENRSPTAQP
jgi:tetratricopeptide (TPR) repeat protein